MEETKKRMKGKVVFKHETEADWLKSNYTPEEGEMVLYDEDDNYDYKRTKYGNGIDKVKDLPFNISSILLEKGEGQNSIQQRATGAKAFGDRSVAFNDSIAGCLGYRYKAIDLYNRKIYLTENEITYSDTELDRKGTLYAANIYVSTTGFTDTQIADYQLIETITLPYGVGDVFTLKTRSTDYDNMGTITHIENNAVTYAGGTALDSLTSDIIRQHDTYIDRYSFSVPAKAQLGHVVVSENATAFGTKETSAIGRFSFAAGRDNLAYGDASTVFGRSNIAGYGSFVAGQGSKGIGDRNFTLGYSCINEGGQAFVTGNGNSAYPEASYSVVGGYSNSSRHAGGVVFGRMNYKTLANDQCIVGRASSNNENAMFIVGNGVIDETTKPISIVSRSNAFIVWNDGRATVGKAPVNAMDVVNKGSLPAFEKGTGDNSIQQIGSFATGFNSFAMYGGTASASQTMALGENAVADIQYAIAIGRGAEARSAYSVAIGLGTKTASPTDSRQNREQIVLGRFNKIIDGASASGRNDGAVLVVGVGIGNTSRENGLVVWGDGRATIGKAPVSDMDIVNKAYLPMVRGTGTNSLQAPQASATGTRATAFGQATASGENALAIGGSTTIASGSNSMAVGEIATATAQNAISLGYMTVASGQWSIALNHGTKAQGRDQIAVGRYNKVLAGPTSYDDKVNGAIFMVGNGFEDTFDTEGNITAENRSNAFVSWNDGHATVGRSTTVNDEALTLTTKDYVDALKARIEALEARL